MTGPNILPALEQRRLAWELAGSAAADRDSRFAELAREHGPGAVLDVVETALGIAEEALARNGLT